MIYKIKENNYHFTDNHMQILLLDIIILIISNFYIPYVEFIYIFFK